MFADQLSIPFVLSAVAVWVMIVVGYGLFLDYRVHHGPR
jgi:hypothetical protein